MKIDSHQHYWQLSRDDYGWLSPEVPVLYKDYLPEDLAPFLKERGIDKTIVVQAAATVEETDFLLALADRNESIVGVVGWADFESDAFESQMEAFMKHPKFVGVRIMLQGLDDPAYVLRSHIVERLSWLADRDFPVDLLVKEHQLPSIAILVQFIPHLRGVIDHIGKPNIAEKSFGSWANTISGIAANPNIYCKLSGMVTEADHSHWTDGDFEPYIHHAVQAFGSKRLMFGSDWPVCLLAASYSQVADVVERALPNLTAEERDDLYGNNASRFYKLK